MRRVLLVLALVVAATLGGGVAGAKIQAASDPSLPPGATPSAGCSSALDDLREQRGAMVGLRAAYAISVRNDWAYHVSQLGPKMIAGEQETDRLLVAMYDACNLTNV